MRVMVFLHGTAIMHATAAGQPRTERVRQSRGRSASVLDFASYLPTEAAVSKVRAWARHGAQICYLSSHRAIADVQFDQQVLAAHGFTPGVVFFRGQDGTYADVVRRSGADVLIEDDCESIGGTGQTVASGLSCTPGRTVRCIVVPEFGGLAHLPNDPEELAKL
jgi:hypothetical protein